MYKIEFYINTFRRSLKRYVVDQFSFVLPQKWICLAFALGLSILRFALHTILVPEDISRSSVRPSRARLRVPPFPHIILEQSSRNWFAESRTRSSSRETGRGGGMDAFKIRERGPAGGREGTNVRGGTEEAKRRASGRWKFSKVQEGGRRRRRGRISLRLRWGR